MNISQKGHWYKCKIAKCTSRIPLPDKIFIETDYNESFEAECKCGQLNYFSWSDAEGETNKLEVDRYFGKNPKFKWFSYWDDLKKGPEPSR